MLVCGKSRGLGCGRKFQLRLSCEKALDWVLCNVRCFFLSGCLGAKPGKLSSLHLARTPAKELLLERHSSHKVMHRNTKASEDEVIWASDNVSPTAVSPGCTVTALVPESSRAPSTPIPMEWHAAYDTMQYQCPCQAGIRCPNIDYSHKVHQTTCKAKRSCANFPHTFFWTQGCCCPGRTIVTPKPRSWALSDLRYEQLQNLRHFPKRMEYNTFNTYRYT